MFECPIKGKSDVIDFRLQPVEPDIVLGTPAHGSRPDLGVDAIVLAGHALVAIGAWQERLAMETGHPSLGPGSVHTSIIRGGEEASSYPASCTITVERRTIPGETGATVREELRKVLDDVAQNVPGFRYRLVPGLERHPFEADPNHPMIRALARNAEQALGHPVAVRAEPFWTDCALIQEAGNVRSRWWWCPRRDGMGGNRFDPHPQRDAGGNDCRLLRVVDCTARSDGRS